MKYLRLTFTLILLSCDWIGGSQAPSLQRLLINLNHTKGKPSCSEPDKCEALQPSETNKTSIIPVFGNEDVSNHTLCNTDQCFEIAEEMRKAMNESIDPCEDFFQYACGNWSSYNPIPDDQGSWDNFQVVSLKLTKQLKEVLEQDDPSDLSTARQKARIFYKACMDLDRMDRLGLQPLWEILESSQKGWPVLSDDWDAREFNWLKTLKRTKKFGLGLLLEWVGAADPENPKRNMIHFVESSLGMSSRKYYFTNHSEFVRTAYKGLMRNMIVLMKEPTGVISVDAMIPLQEDIDNIYSLEEFFANITRTEEDRRNLTLSLNKMTLQDFHSRCLNSSLTLDELLDYMKEIMPNSTLKDFVKPDMLVNVANPDYFIRVHKHLAAHSTDMAFQRKLANYVGWRTSMEFAAKTTKQLREVVEAFSQAVDGSKKEPERWKICANKANNVMNTAVGSLYVKNYFDESSKPKIASLVKDLREAFSHLLKRADWMDDGTKGKAFAKLDAMYEYIGYADYIVDNSPRLDKEYDGLTFGPDHLRNSMNINKFSVETNLKDLLKKNNRSLDEVLTPADVNAFYDPSNNIIAFVAGILQYPFYDAKRPEYLNYAAIGAIIGHEITHGFDDQGSLFDGDGKFFDWWSTESRQRYTHKATGLTEKYGNFSLPQGHVNGYLTLGENIADCGGVKEALEAYQLYIHRKGKLEPILPGFENFTTQQLFFLGVAQDWCGSDRNKTASTLLLTASHAPRKFRVNGPLSSMPEFSESYQCPLGSPMNPVVKAAVW